MSELKTTEFDTQSDVREEVVVLPEESRNNETVDDGRENFVDFQINSDSEGESADIGEDADTSDSDGAGQNSAVQTRAENAAIRAARLRAVREAEARAEARADRDIAQSGVMNPRTGKPFKSMKEFREYGAYAKRQSLEARAQREGRTVEEVEEEDLNRQFITNMRRKEEAKTAPDDSDSFIKSDVLEFVERFPEFDTPAKLENLENNKAFREFCGSRFGREPLAELYSSYISLVGRVEDAAVAKNTSRASRSTGGGTPGGASLTPSQKKTLDEWNSAYPDMQMTPKEFLSR